jgi:hypothetical protein
MVPSPGAVTVTGDAPALARHRMALQLGRHHGQPGQDVGTDVRSTYMVVVKLLVMLAYQAYNGGWHIRRSAPMDYHSTAAWLARSFAGSFDRTGAPACTPPAPEHRQDSAAHARDGIGTSP